MGIELKKNLNLMDTKTQSLDVISQSKSLATMTRNSDGYKEVKEKEERLMKSGKLHEVKMGKTIIMTTDPEKWENYK